MDGGPVFTTVLDQQRAGQPSHGCCRKASSLQRPELQACSLYLLHTEFQRWCWKCLFLGPAPHPGARLANADIPVDRACFVPGPSLCPRDLSRLPQIPWASPLATVLLTVPGQEMPHNHTEEPPGNPWAPATAGSFQPSPLPLWEVSLFGRLIFNSFTYFWSMYMHIPQNYKRT